MQWFLVVMISLCWFDVAAAQCLDLTEAQCRENMINDWKDTSKYKAILLQPLEQAYLLQIGSCESGDGPPGIRRECRTLSSEALKLLWAAFKYLFTTTIIPGGLTRYQLFVTVHRSIVAPGAHGGPCFPTWHRHFLCRLEKALQEYNSTVRLCYWDSSLDSHLPDVADSAFWSADYLGNNKDFVTTGFAANLPAFPPDCSVSLLGWPTLYREFGVNCLPDQNQINALYTKCSSYTEFMTPIDMSDFETLHGNAHMCVGGHMSIITCSPNDPVFWLHHTNVDRLWELCRQMQTKNVTQDYPGTFPFDLVDIPPYHQSYAPMQPYMTKTCKYGLSYNYIPRQYTYANSPSACSTNADCGGKALWCNSGTCMASVGPNGKMGANYPDAACFFPGCPTPRKINGVCKCAP